MSLTQVTVGMPGCAAEQRLFTKNICGRDGYDHGHRNRIGSKIYIVSMFNEIFIETILLKSLLNVKNNGLLEIRVCFR